MRRSRAERRDTLLCLLARTSSSQKESKAQVTRLFPRLGAAVLKQLSPITRQGEFLMGNNLQKLSGGCQCGAVRYQVTGEVGHPHLCHCRMCQKASGNFFLPLIGAAKSDLNGPAANPPGSTLPSLSAGVSVEPAARLWPLIRLATTTFPLPMAAWTMLPQSRRLNSPVSRGECRSMGIFSN